MEKYFVTYNQSLALKMLGFDEPCMGKYDTKQGDEWLINIYSGHLNIQFGDKNKACIAPLRSQVFAWFREKHGLFSEIQPYLIIGTQWRYTITNRNNSSGLPHKEQFKTYEEAESACIDQLIEIIKNK